MKTCSRCRVSKEEAEFGSAKGNKDGLCYWCKVCRSLHRAPRKASEIEGVKRYLLVHRKRIAEKECPKRRGARVAVGNALRDGKLMKTPCMCCGNPRSEAHHADYDRPLDVVWLCKKHHSECHKLAATAPMAMATAQPQMELV